MCRASPSSAGTRGKVLVSTEDLLQSLFTASLGFPHSSVGKESTCNAGDPGSIPGSGRSAGEGIGYPLQDSGLENSRDYIVQGVTKSQTRLSDFHFHFVLSGPIRSSPPSPGSPELRQL